MHVLTLLHRIMGKYQLSCGDIEMAKRRLGQARNMFKLGNMFFLSYTTYKLSKKFKLA